MSYHDSFAEHARFDSPKGWDSVEADVEPATIKSKPGMLPEAAGAHEALDRVASLVTRGRRDLKSIARLTAQYDIETDVHNNVFSTIASATLRQVKLTLRAAAY
jgi:hypothetical protein